MKKRKFISTLLGLSLCFTMAMPGVASKAVSAGIDTNDNGMVINKTATANGDGTYTIQLEAYATGSKVITEVKKDVPTDIVLVLDQSGSMADSLSSYDSYAFRKYENKSNGDFYKLRHNDNGEYSNNLYYDIGNGVYATVSVTITGPLQYSPISNQNNWYYYRNQSNLKRKVGDEYKDVIVKYESTGSGWNPRWVFKYYSDGTEIGTSQSWDDVPDFSNDFYVASLDEANSVYTYTCTDAENKTIKIGESKGINTEPEFNLYERYNAGSITKLNALKNAVSNFVTSVNEKAAGEDKQLGTADDIAHRIAVVGFASQNGNGNNTELLSISGSNSGSVGIAYNSIRDSHLTNVLQNMTSSEGQNMVQSAINALSAEGATRADLGMDMAERILTKNLLPEGTERNRVVILFTDGSPTSSNGFEKGVADSAITKADSIKGTGAKVYSIGVFSGANAQSSGNSSGNLTERCNWFMQNVSSNNGTPQSPSYYLSAADADTLNSIFQQISSNIESGGSATTLGSSAVIKDVIAPEFTLPDGTTADAISVKTFHYHGENSDSVWTDNNDAMGASASISEDGTTVNVTGFDFSANWCGVDKNADGTETTHKGNKLVISFTVKPKDGFLGGNNVCTNASAGVYENVDASEPSFVFDRPQVNVPIQSITVDALDKNVYLLGGVTADQLRSGATVTIGDADRNGNITLNISPDAVNYGIQPWQYQYVDISVAVMNGKTPITDLTNLRADQTYNIVVTVTPKTNGDGANGTAATAMSGESNEKNINVFKPELTFRDNSVYYGDKAPTQEALFANRQATAWKHEDAIDSDVSMIGDVPIVDVAYTIDSTKINNGLINSKEDIGVAITPTISNVDVSEYTDLVHQECDSDPHKIELDPTTSCAFLLHVQTCQLTITKQGGADDEPYVFVVNKDGAKYSEVTIVGNKSKTLYELPVGKYTITEDENWSWRYSIDSYNPAPTTDSPSGTSGSVELSSASDSGTITCTNKKDNNSWLNDFSTVVQNIYEKAH